MKASHARLLLFLGLLLSFVTFSGAQDRPPICEQIAKAYGLDSFKQVEQIRFTFHIDSGEIKIARTWVWEPKTDRVTYDGLDKTGNPAKLTYLRAQLNTQPAMVKEEIDPAFINDKYWLIFPFQLAWDTSAKVEDTGAHKLPLGKGSANRVVVTYPAQGGYTPGDAYELFIGPDKRIQEWIFRRGGSAKPTLIATWADHKKAGPLLVALDHRGTWMGKPARIFFTDVAVKLVGSSTWTNAQ
jgi:hypothetical protein